MGETFQSEDQDSQQSGSAASEDLGWWGRRSATAWGRGGVWGSCLFVQVSADAGGLADEDGFYLSGATCEEEGMEDIPFGEARREEEGAVYR